MRHYIILFCLIAFFPGTASPSGIEGLPLNPERKASFSKQFGILTFALGMYYLDARNRLPKSEIKDKMAARSGFWKKELNLVFDMDNMGFRKKGFTRYYPFTVEGRDLIIRIFDAREKDYLPSFKVFEEGVFEDSGIGFQIIPGIQEILATKEIKKMPFPEPAIFSTSP